MKDNESVSKPGIPPGYETYAEFLSEMMENYDLGVEADDHNRRAMIEDIEFTYGDGWDPVVKAAREKKRKPVLSIPRIPAFVAQIVNNRLLNETEIRVYPEREGTKEVAELRQGLLRAIFKTRESDFSRDEAMKYQVICGVGYFSLTTEYAADEVFDQNIVFEPVVDPLSVVIDPMATLPCGGDAEYGFLTRNVPTKAFKKKYPWASQTAFADRASTTGNDWFQQEAIRVVAYWRMVVKGTKTIVLLADGQHKEIKPEPGLDVPAAIAMLTQAGLIASRPDGSPYVKEVPNRCAEMYLCSGADILEGPFTLPISSIPIFRVPGWELRNGDKVYRWGLVRLLKDSQRLHNYQRSLLAEQMVAAPRNKWITTRDAIAGNETEWRNSHLSDDPVLIYNSDGAKPERIPAPPVDQALLTETGMTVQDMRDVSNIHEASLGMKSNEVSGKAIQARQSMTDLSSFIYHDRMRLAEERAAKTCDELLPTTHDTFRVISIMGKEDKIVQAVINDPTNPMSDISVGKYGLSVTTGPATITKRALAREEITALMTRAPELIPQYMDLLMKTIDAPFMSEWEDRAKKLMPPELSDEEMTPEQQQKAQEEAQKMQIVEEIELRKALAEIKGIEAETTERLARAKQFEAQAVKAMSDAQARADDVEGKNLERDMDARLRVVEAAMGAQDDGSDDGNDGSAD